MTNEALVARLKAKITKEEDLPDAYLQAEITLRSPSGERLAIPWWLKREYLRQKYGAYAPVTQILQNVINQMPWSAIHISGEDATQICYTPDKAYGEADRQVRTSLARFLTKYYPFLPDTDVRDLQIMHLAEIDNSFEEIRGPAIVEAYRNLGKGEGTGACMSNVESHYPGGNPTVLYDHPAVSMAVLRNSKGAITSRSMLYCPTPEDKRFIRVFGDGLLRRKLERLGYEPSSWLGIKFKAIPVPTHRPNDALRTAGLETYIVPYLDNSGGRGDVTSSSVAFVDGALEVISPEVRGYLTQTFGQDAVATATSEYGFVRLKPSTLANTDRTCYLTGVSASVVTNEFVAYWDETGKHLALKTAVEDMPCVFVNVAERLKAYVTASTKRFSLTYTQSRRYGSLDAMDTEENRFYLEWKKLDPLIYPEYRESWVASEECEKTVRDTYIFKGEAVAVYNNGIWEREHQSVIDKTYIRLHPLNGAKSYAVAGTPILRTISGAKVVAGTAYDIVQCFGGAWTFSRQAKNVSVLGELIALARTQERDASPGSSMFVSIFEKQLAEALNAGQTLESFVVSKLLDQFAGYRMIGSVQKSRAKLEFLRVDHFRAATSSQESAGYFTVSWLINYWDRCQAEMNALDYSLGSPQVDLTAPKVVKSYHELETEHNLYLKDLADKALEKAREQARQVRAITAVTLDEDYLKQFDKTLESYTDALIAASEFESFVCSQATFYAQDRYNAGSLVSDAQAELRVFKADTAVYVKSAQFRELSRRTALDLNASETTLVPGLETVSGLEAVSVALQSFENALTESVRNTSHLTVYPFSTQDSRPENSVLPVPDFNSVQLALVERTNGINPVIINERYIHAVTAPYVVSIT